MAVLKYSQNNTNDLLVMLRMFVNDVHYMLIDSKQINEEYLEHINHSKEIIEELDITLSLSDDTEGLDEALTIDQSDELSDMGQSDEMGPPRFMYAENAPVCTYRPAANYPEMASMAGVEGLVT
ncbi:MAG TPA: hypothetical protein ENK70_08445, partial [Methylophaga sp.]|nr:hypothetical protein [Methylophaga sp.]